MGGSSLIAWGSLLGGFGAALTGLTGFVLGMVSLRRSRRETRRAAERATDRIFHPGPEEEAVLTTTLLEILLHQHHELPELPEGHHVHHPGDHGGGGTS